MNSSTSGSSSRRVIPSQRVVVAASPIPVAQPAPSENDSPGIRVVRDGEFVRAIEVTCPCGQCMRLICQYDQQEPADGPPKSSFERHPSVDPAGTEVAQR